MSPACQAIGKAGLPLLRDGCNVLTHCNAGWLATVDWGTALAPIYAAHEAGMRVHVWVDETRPRNQGLLTAWELAQHGVPHTVIADNAGGQLMQHGKVDLCIVGTDRTRGNGDVCNKIGTYLKALAAHDNNVPFYVAVPALEHRLAIDDGAPIRDRGAQRRRGAHRRRRDRRQLARVRIAEAPRREPGVRRDAGAARHRLHHRDAASPRPRGLPAVPGAAVTLALRDELRRDREADERARPDAGHVGQRQRAQRARPARHAGGHAVRRAAAPTMSSSSPATAPRGPASARRRREWRLHRDILAARRDVNAIVHTHSLYCTTLVDAAPRRSPRCTT